MGYATRQRMSGRVYCAPLSILLIQEDSWLLNLLDTRPMSKEHRWVMSYPGWWEVKRSLHHSSQGWDFSPIRVYVLAAKPVRLLASSGTSFQRRNRAGQGRAMIIPAN